MSRRRMGGADAGFLYAESAVQSTTVPVLIVLRPEGGGPTEARPLVVDDLRAHVEARLDLLPSFRRRVERVPFGVAHPVLVDDPDFDLGYHVRHVTLDDPSEAGLHAFVAEQQEVRLDRRHPLWRLVLVDGLQDGRQGLVLLLGHAVADGVALRTTMRRLLTDVDPGEREAVRAAEPYRPETVRRRRLLADALADLGPALARLARLLVRFGLRSRAVAARRERAEAVVPEASDTPVTALNDAWSGHRRVAVSSVPLADLRRVRAAAGVTINEVLLALAASALRAHLGADLPEGPLTVNIPASTEPRADPGQPDRQWGNHFTNHLGSLATDVDDPVERLRAVTAAARESRAQLEVLGPTLLADLLEAIPGSIAERGARWLSAEKRAHAADRADYSVLLSNMRGADAPYSFAGPHGPVLVERTLVFGMPFEGSGLSLVAWTYGDRVDLTAMSDADAVADPAPILGSMRAALDELETALDPAARADLDLAEVTGAPSQR